MVFDLTDEELKATRELHKSNKTIKTADEMFKELGYVKSSQPFDKIKYYKDDDNVFYFDCISQEFIKSGAYDGMCDGITMQELKAINKKCLEMRVVR